ncbi:MAG: ankyrin repeat domain-containing protein [Xanthomonadaceae bacterium]|nr:ankyrin repeat domain-containing protein [Xanthomonadaceae bacterium]
MKKEQASEPTALKASHVLAAFAAEGDLPDSALVLVAAVEQLATAHAWFGMRWNDCEAASWMLAENLAYRGCALLHRATRWQRYELIYSALCRSDRAQAAAWIFRRAAEKRAATERRPPLNWGTSPLDVLCVRERSTPIIEAVKCGTYTYFLHYMLGLGAAVDGADAEGQTALHRAVWHRFPPKEDAYTIFTVEFLIEKGVEVNARDANGCTALDLAIRRRRTRLFKPLVLAGAKATSEKQLASVRRVADRQGWRDQTEAIEAAWSEVAFRTRFPPAKEWKKSDGGRF